MFQNLAKFVSEKCPMITLGSGAEYDKSKPIVLAKEIDFGKTIPSDPYGYSKYLIAKEIEKKDFIESEICLFMIEALLVAYQAFIPLLFLLKENLLFQVLTPFSQGAH